ncbi:MAG TPA: DUF488 domain-containing protein [Geobacteraceae bacterium]|nr:DUF488 domain-containing protein [Geobacteraceae bacterium]
MSGRTGPEKVPTANEGTILTIGHSTRPMEEFVTLLLENGVRRIVDVRTIPRSRHNPQFNRDTLPETLAENDIGYSHMPGLGGLRRVRADSPNRGWHNDSFRGFADYMQTGEFAENIEKLSEFGRRERVAIMCAETLPWRCHRSLIADALLVRGARVIHIIGKGKLIVHELTPFARIDGVTVTYPSETSKIQESSRSHKK